MNDEEQPSLHPLYTAGYTGYDPEALKAKAEALDALVVDVRYKPFSRDPRWSQKALRDRLGDRYRHCGALGNRNYKGDGPVELVDPEAGYDYVRYALAKRPVILLCACANHRACHRRNAADYISGRCGCEVVHLYPEKAERKPSVGKTPAKVQLALELPP